ncbi:MAG: acetate--CoA ligase family protein [Anaerolineales bacterium]|jgi:acetyltransferase
MKSDPSLKPFFSPQGVAIIGASLEPTKLGFGLVRNLVQSGYQGAIHLVNVRGQQLMGLPVYHQIHEIPDPVDLGVLLIPAQAVPQAIEHCSQRGIKALIIGSGGFRETGEAGAQLEQKCLEIAQENGVRLLGPNSIGIIDTHSPIDTTFLSPPGPTPGDIAFISHSGAICSAVIDWARGQGFGLSRLVGMGNQCDVTESDLLGPVADDPYTRVIALYLEGVSNGRKFLQQAQSVSRVKPIVALKVGRYERSKAAVASHTGALAGLESAYNAAFRRAGVIRAETTEQLFDWARALAWCPLPKGCSVAVLTNAGGPGVTAVDALESKDLQLAVLSPDTQAELGELLNPAASLNNPVDMLAAATPHQYARCLQVLISDANVDSVMVILPPPPMHTAGGIAKAIIPVIYTSDKPVVVALMGERLIQEAVEHFRAARIPDYRFPERAAEALDVLSQRFEYLSALDLHRDEVPGNFTDIQKKRADTILTKYQSTEFLSDEDGFDLLTAYGIPSMKPRLAQSEHQAVEVAQELGYPLAMKIASPQITHKSDVGGVLLNLQNSDEVLESYNKIIENARSAKPDAKIKGVYLQRMLSSGQDVIIGAVQDSQFGALLMFGSGGIEVEKMRDVRFELAPIAKTGAEKMLAATWAGKKLEGYRNIPPADRAALIDALLRLSKLAIDYPQLAEIEINPFTVLRSGEGAFAIDVRVRMG